MVSVIVPVYKIEEALLRRCLQSLTDQTEPSAEFIVVDDGSPDHCGEIIDEFAARDRRFTAVHTDNFGVSNARNEGLGLASGTYILFVDGDDHVHPELCEKCCRAMEQAGTDILFFMYQSSDGGADDFVRDESVEELSESFLRRIRISVVSQENPVPGVMVGSPWGKVFRRSVIEANHLRFVQGLKKCQDRVFLLDYLLQARTAALFRWIGYQYVVHENSVCRRYNPDIADILDFAGTEFEKRRVQIAPEERAAYDAALSNLYMSFLYDCLTLNVFHRENQQSFRQKRAAAKDLLAKPCFRDGLKGGNLHAMNGKKRRLVLKLLRCHMVAPACLLLRLTA